MGINIRLYRTMAKKVITLDIEDYIKGVVAAEMGERFAIEALKAQAVAARTFTLHRLKSVRSGALWDLNDSPSDGYQAFKVITNVEEYPQTIAAVTATAGLVITYAGKIAEALYSASNGGRTVSSETKWGNKRDYLIEKYDPYNKASGKAKNGHGVGLSQWGADAAARYPYAMTYRRILEFYYPGTTLTPNYAGAGTGGGSTGGGGVGRATVLLGTEIVRIAREQIGKPYSTSSGKRLGPNSFDCSGLCIYCYKHAGVPLDGGTSIGIYNAYKDKAQKVSLKDTRAGDLLFYTNTTDKYGGRNPPITHIAIANGSGGKIHAGDPVKEDSHLKGYSYITKKTESDPYAILRVLSDYRTLPAESAPGDTTYTGSTGFNSLSLSDDYRQYVVANLSKVEEAGYDYGYLIDLTNGGEFKFYIPEFTESAGANWESVAIRGRSVDIKSYQSTNSRSVVISLELYAGEGLYDKPESPDIVGELHKDVNFVKSLEYPDYTSTSIVLPPTAVHLILGASLNMVGIVSGVSVEHLKPHDDKKRSMYVKITFTVTQIATNPMDYSDIRGKRTPVHASYNNDSTINYIPVEGLLE